MNGVHMNVGTIARIAGTSLGGILLVVMSLQYMYAFSMAAYALLFLSTFFLQFVEDKKSTTPSKQAAKDNSFYGSISYFKRNSDCFHSTYIKYYSLYYL